jgi:hypothetical protein
MTSSDTITASFPVQALMPVATGTNGPTYQNIIVARTKLNSNAASIFSTAHHRNSSRHGANKEENHAIRRGRLLISIRALYAEAPHMLAADRDTLALPLETRMKKSPAGLEIWLRRTCNIAKLSKQDALAALKCTHLQDPHQIFQTPKEERKRT